MYQRFNFRNRDMQLVVEVSDEEDSNLAWTMISGMPLRLLPPYATIKTVFSMVALNHGLQVIFLSYIKKKYIYYILFHVLGYIWYKIKRINTQPHIHIQQFWSCICHSKH